MGLLGVNVGGRRHTTNAAKRPPAVVRPCGPNPLNAVSGSCRHREQFHDEVIGTEYGRHGLCPNLLCLIEDHLGRFRGALRQRDNKLS